MGELAADQVAHGDQVSGGAIGSNRQLTTFAAGSGHLQRSREDRESALEAGVKCLEDAVLALH